MTIIVLSCFEVKYNACLTFALKIVFNYALAEDLNEQLKTEQTRSLQLQEKLRSLPAVERDLSEARSQNRTLSDENKSLREANDQLVNAAFQRESDMQQRERSLAEKLSSAEKIVNSENTDLRVSLEQALRAKACLETDVEHLQRRLRNAEDLAKQSEERLRRKEQELIIEQRERRGLEQSRFQSSSNNQHGSPRRSRGVLVHQETNTKEEDFVCKNCVESRRLSGGGVRLMDLVPERGDSFTKRELADLQVK